VSDEATLPLPDDPALAAAASALNSAGYWAELVDHEWRLVFMTDELRFSYGDLLGHAAVPVGAFYFGPEASASRLGGRVGPRTMEIQRIQLAALGPWTLSDLGGDRDALADMVIPEVRDIAMQLEPDSVPALTYEQKSAGPRGGLLDIPATAFRIHAADGRLAGTAILYKPAAGMATLSTMAAAGDLRHFERMQAVAHPARRPAAILFADLEGSSTLSRRLSTASYFTLGRRLVRAADACVVEAGGLVGRHVGDGVVAFFLAETAGSESAAARACIAAARNLRLALADVAARSGLEGADVVLRFGLHWGSTLYVGQIISVGRSEVTALGDEVNEAARIEVCATGGRALASKTLVERLDPGDAAALDIDADAITYVPVAELPTATEKARRDAPAIAVCEV
jgi:class 3 adenylate cyclase